ncbi:MAG: histidinol-phosphate transaminase [Bacteroidales bacterium]|nr:histidinol-phosphate transaminase [Bacteroidales bacterium]
MTNMKKDDIYGLIRENIRALAPYSTARDECKIDMEVYLDANESPYETGVNRYPSPFQEELKRMVSSIRRVPVENIFLGNGSDEAIDLIYRIFCTPGKSSAVVVAPSYGMYSVAGNINDVKIIYSELDSEFQLNATKLLSDVQDDTRVVFICSPNNPSGNLLDREEIIRIIENFNGIVVVDEAYIDFAESQSFSELIGRYPNLIVLQTLSKAWGMAGLRLGIALADTITIGTMNKVKYPYNISIINQQKAIEMLKDCVGTVERIREIKENRSKLAMELSQMECVSKVYPSDANFLLVKFKEREKVFKELQERKIIVRDRSSQLHCKDCLRITMGTEDENRRLLDAIREITGEIESKAGPSSKKEGCITEGKKCRVGKVSRSTRETSIQVCINLDSFTRPYVRSGLPFFDHMLEQIGYHGGIGVDIICCGDIATGCHHTVEDTGIALGEALAQALGPKKGIERYGFALPMDEADAMVLIDLGGRIDFKWDVEFREQFVGEIDTQMFSHFFKSLAENLKCNLHVKAKGENDHHIIEGVFKAFARALKCAVRKDEFSYGVASSKGVL